LVQIVQTRWFELVDFCIALTSGIILILWPGLGYWPVLFALLPWAARLAAGRFPFKRTAFDLPLALFIGTAMIGVWAAYNREAAWLKFWMLVAAMLVFYALAGQPLENLGAVAGLLSLVGVMLAIYFLFSFDWSSQPEDLIVIERLAAFWMGIRPGFKLVPLLPNIVGGILAMLLPISIVPAALEWRSRRYYKFGLSVAAAAIILFGLFLTSSRGAWLALLAASGFWLVWRASELISFQRPVSRLRVFAIAPVLFFITIAIVLWIYPGSVLAVLDRLPGLPSGESRLDLAGNTLHLIADFPWTGAGLGSFGGIYSQYIKVIPFKFYDYSHNFYLDLAVEQGVFASLLIVVIFAWAGWLFLNSLEYDARKVTIHLLAAAGFTSLIVVLLHGFMDDALYGMGSTPFLFLLPGLAVAVSGCRVRNQAKNGEPVAGVSSLSLDHPRVWVLSAGLILLVVSSVFLKFRSLQASWFADLGAVKMSRLELAIWPMEEWNSNPDISAFAPVVKLFERSLFEDPEKATAHHRLGLIALQGRDFINAQNHLEKALQRNPDHQGIRKVLGYVYVWNDQPEKAAVLLSQIPEAVPELRQYIIWWKKQHRQDLVIKAEDMLENLSSKNGTLLQAETSQQ
jgi:putative inorganic carbon (HCO3(-)) transporter